MIVPKYSIGQEVFFVHTFSYMKGGEKYLVFSKGVIYNLTVGEKGKLEYSIGITPQDRYPVSEDRIFLKEEDAIDYMNKEVNKWQNG